MNSSGGNGLGIPTRFRSYGLEKATQWLETRLTKIEEELKESVNITSNKTQDFCGRMVL